MDQLTSKGAGSRVLFSAGCRNGNRLDCVANRFLSGRSTAVGTEANRNLAFDLRDRVPPFLPLRPFSCAGVARSRQPVEMDRLEVG
jgi:hypothetical protein